MKKIRIFDIVISVLLAAVLTLQIVTMTAVFGKKEEAVEENTKEKVDLSVVQIDSPYCVLKYPSLYMEEMVYEGKTEGAVYSAIFGCKLGEKTQTLFMLHFNSEETQNVVATVSKKGVSVPVVLELAELQTDLWTTEELKIVKKMQEARETVIQSIKDHVEIF